LIDVKTGTVQKTLDAGSSPRSIALSADGKLVFVTNFGEENLSVIDTAGQRMVQHYRIPLM
jgi:DNA-binding beta-propeller fold protein YncE